MANNPLTALDEIYDEQVKEIDKAGYAEKLKACAELFFQKVNEEYALEENPVHFEDIQFLGGYFIFGHGTNSVVHFHIKECPGWLFGIWWAVPDCPNDENKNKYISGEFFTQYEETLDKFKPSRSNICTTISAIAGERYMPDSDYGIRVEFYEKLKSLYDEFGYEYEELCGTYYSNFCAVRDYINKLYEEDDK